MYVPPERKEREQAQEMHAHEPMKGGREGKARPADPLSAREPTLGAAGHNSYCLRTPPVPYGLIPSFCAVVVLFRDGIVGILRASRASSKACPRSIPEHVASDIAQVSRLLSASGLTSSVEGCEKAFIESRGRHRSLRVFSAPVLLASTLTAKRHTSFE